jgi:hypothetical protein
MKLFWGLCGEDEGFSYGITNAILEGKTFVDCVW